MGIRGCWGVGVVGGGGGLQFQIHSSARIHVQIYLNKKSYNRGSGQNRISVSDGQWLYLLSSE